VLIVLRDSHTDIVTVTVVYIYIHLMQSVAFSMNFCQQFEGYQSTGDAKPSRSSDRSIYLPWRTENSASKPLFSILADG